VARAFTAQGEKIPVPKSYRQAVEDPTFEEDWKDAVKRELTALKANGTWEQTVPPREANIITSRWVFDVIVSIIFTIAFTNQSLVLEEEEGAYQIACLLWRLAWGSL
jgi:hypothetical protein